ncbi:hypothetical protein O988_09123 [Pseudogymnoascus sp. VKM F-3808]|nr:hypothetical protein O988_09123 [Pseudogymnoascus sp. VKM F-3808]
MSSFFFSTTSPPKARYPIPPPLDYEAVLEILHNETLLHQVFYPELYSTPIQEDEDMTGLENKAALEKRAGATGLANTSTGQPDPKVSLSPLSNGISCIEEMPLGFTATTTYTLSTSTPSPSTTSPDPSSPNQGAQSSSDSTLYLEEHRSFRALKPITRWVTYAEGPILKTRNLLRFLEEMSASGGRNDIDSALASLYSPGSLGKTDKYKDE